MMEVTLPPTVTGTGIRTVMLTRRFGRMTALSEVELDVPQGSICVLAGENGAGKTTLLRILLGLLSPDQGAAYVCGVLSGPGGRSRARIGYVPETGNLPWGALRVRDLLAYGARHRGTWDAGYAARLISALDIDVTRRLGGLSKGSLRRVQLAEALAHRPPVLLLDEPTDGLDPLARDTVLRLLVEHVADAPTTVLVASHVVHELERVADRIAVLQQGRLLAQLGRDELRAQLRRFRSTTPAEWNEPALDVAHRNDGRGEHEWIVRGDHQAVASRLADSGATSVTSVPLTLDEAVITILRKVDR